MPNQLGAAQGARGARSVYAPAASAVRTTTLHFCSVQQTFTATNSAGQPIAGNAQQFTVGDSYDSTDLYFVGNHTHHASTFSASDHYACTFTGPTQTCSIQIAIGGSLLLLNRVTLPSNANTASAPVNAGTGKYKNAHGTFVSTLLGNSNNSENTVTLTG